MNKVEWKSLFIFCTYDEESINAIFDGGGDASPIESDLLISQTACRNLCIRIPAIKRIVGSCASEATAELSGFQNYILNNGFDFVGKTEWVASFFYFFLKSKNVLNASKSLASLTSQDVGSFADEFHVFASQVYPLIKKAYPIENAVSFQNSKLEFADYLIQGFVSDLSVVQGGNFRIEIHNPIALERFSRFLREEGILQDYSFNSSIRVINYESVKRLVDCIDKECRKEDLDAIFEKLEAEKKYSKLSAHLKKKLQGNDRFGDAFKIMDFVSFVVSSLQTFSQGANLVGFLLKIISTHFVSVPN